MQRWQNRVAVVTGASSGIGACICKDLIWNGLIVVGLARRKERVDELRASLPAKLQSHLHAVKCDVSDLNSVTKAFDWIEQTLCSIDILVNNAGTASTGQLLTMDIAQIQNVLQTNVMGVVHCTQRAFKSMKARNFEGHIVVLNSIAGHQIFNPPAGTLPIFNIYPASKYAVTAIAEVLRQELRDFKTKIKITSISPGFVNTEIVPDHLRTSVMLKPEDISEGILYAIGTPPHVQVHELTIKPVGEAV